MRILYIDIDSLRPDHLGCYGYCRDTSPNIDAVAERGVRYTNCYTPDAPCLPSRTALFTGRFGIHTGVVNHGGTAADVWPVGPEREFRSQLHTTTWAAQLAKAKQYTVMVSPFPERHSAFQVVAGFREWYNPGKGGQERADEIQPFAQEWLERNGHLSNWFLHVNYWDPHTPYQAPESFGNPFEDGPYDEWLTQEHLDELYHGYGPHSAQDPPMQGTDRFPRMPDTVRTVNDFRRWIDGYDCGVAYADRHVGMLLNILADKGVLDETVVIISADHGENLGEHNVFGDHQTADYCTSRIPLVIKWPGIEPRVDDRLLYHVDMAAGVVERVGGVVPSDPDHPAGPWDGAAAYAGLEDDGGERRDSLVVSQCAWACQRTVRWSSWLLIRTYHAGWKDFADVELYHVDEDPHMLSDLASTRPEVANEGLAILERWHGDQMQRSPYQVDPLWNVIREGGPLHTRNQRRNVEYLNRLRATGRSHHAEHLERVYGLQE